MFTIEDARRVQRDLKLTDRHVVYIDLEHGFAIAHSQDERDQGDDLTQCVVHKWLAYDVYGMLECCFTDSGWYEVHGLHDVQGLAL